MAEGVMPLKLDWLYLNADVEDPNGVQWICTDCTGLWDSPNPRVNLTERVISHGAFMGPMYMKERIITIKGRAFAPDFDTLRTAQARVAGLCSDPNTTYDLVCESELGTLTCGVRLDGQTLTNPFAVFTPAFEFSMQLVAVDPRKYSNNWNMFTAGLASEGSGTGLNFGTWPVPNPPIDGLDFGTGSDTSGLVFGTSTTTGAVRLFNAGTAPSAPIYRLVGPLTTPTLTTVSESGVPAMMTYNATLGDGETVVINPLAPSVLLGGTASRRYLLNPANFSGFVIPPANPATDAPGVLQVGLVHQGPTTAAGYMQASYRDAWW